MGRLIEATHGVLFASVIFNRSRLDAKDLVEFWNSRYEVCELFYPKFNPSLDYYSKEMGSDLSRLLIVAKNKCDREALLAEKKWAYEMELSLSAPDGKRTVNIDPGIILPEQLLLATTKPYSHRIYIGKNIWLELTYIFRDKSYRALEWTYPDYADEEKIVFFNRMRSKLL